MNRVHNISNPYQGNRKKTLCVCSAGLLRSPTLAYVLSNPPYNRNTRAVGYNKEYALIPLEEILIHWADEVVCVDKESEDAVRSLYNEKFPVKVITLNIPDIYSAFSHELLEAIETNLKEINYI